MQVLSVLRTVLGHLGAATHHELIRSVLSFLVSLIVSGAAGPTLDLVRDMSKKGMDPSLMRHFVELVSETHRHTCDSMLCWCCTSLMIVHLNMAVCVACINGGYSSPAQESSLLQWSLDLSCTVAGSIDRPTSSDCPTS